MSKEQNSGFTLVEMMMVIAIIVIMSFTMILNFRSASSNITARNQTTAAVVSDIRRAQTLTTNSNLVNGNIVCGYGIHYVSSLSNNHYLIYAKSKPVNGCSTLPTRNYVPGDIFFQDIILANTNMEIAAKCTQDANLFVAFDGADIFFEPPDPKTYINNDSSLAAKPVNIYVRLKAMSCAAPAAIIIVKPSGSIDVTTQ